MTVMRKITRKLIGSNRDFDGQGKGRINNKLSTCNLGVSGVSQRKSGRKGRQLR